MNQSIALRCLSLATLVCLLGPAMAKPIRDVKPKEIIKPLEKESPRPEWTMDLSKMNFPTEAASGIIGSQTFKADTATLQKGVLHLREQGGRAQMIIFLFLNQGEALDGKTWTITPEGRQNKTPHVHFHAIRSGATASNYAMKLEFGMSMNGKTPGKIFVCLPDPDKTFVAGTFEVENK